MRIPKGKAIHKELSSNFVDLKKLLDDFRANGFSGFIELIGLKNEGEILLEGGKVINVHLNADEKLIGKKYINEALEFANQEDVLISTYQLPPESVLFISSFLYSKKIHDNLSSEFTDPNKLLSKFSNEKGEFFIEVIFQKNLGSGLLFIQDGHVVDALLSLLDKNVTTGESAIRDIIEGSRELGAIYNIYKGVVETASLAVNKQNISNKELAEVFEYLLSYIEEFLKNRYPKNFDPESFIKESCINIAEKYPFMDPFAAEVSLNEGKVKIDSEETPQVLAAGIVALIMNIIQRVSQDKKTFPIEEFKIKISEHLQRKYPFITDELRLIELINKL